MITALLTVLIIADIVLLGLIFAINRRQNDNTELLQELSEERNIIGEIRRATQEELGFVQSDCRDILKKVTHLAAETEQELKNSSTTIAQEMESVVNELREQLAQPLKDLGRRQASLEATLRKIEREKKLIQKLLGKGEKLARFFDKKISYEELVEELEERKYADAMALLAQGHSPESIATELGMSAAEVKLLSGFNG